MKTTNTKKEDGVTLIAIIITIIILLILAGITIGTLTGENGIIQNARKCKRASGNSKRKRNC